MNVNVTGSLIFLGILAACIILPPMADLFFEWLNARYGKNAQGYQLSLRQTAVKKYSGIWLSVDEPITLRICMLLYLGFSAMALCVLTMQLNMLFALSLQAFGFLSMFVGELSLSRLQQEEVSKRLMKDFLTFQPVLLAAAIGFFFVTGSFSIADSLQQPKLLIAEMPLLFLVLVCFSYSSAKDNFAAGQRKSDVMETGSCCGFAAAARQLAEVYRLAFFLLLAGLLVGCGRATAALVTVALYALMVWEGPVIQRWIRRSRFELSWTHAFFAAGLNLTWLYIKYIQ